MSVLTIINKQLCEILQLMKKDLSRNEFVNNYFICEDDCKLLPKQELQDYLTITKIENTYFLLGINKLCLQIIDIWNNDFDSLKLREFDKTFHSDNVIFATTFFRAIHLTEEKWHYWSSIEAKKDFTENKNYETYQIAHIAARCSLILNCVTAAYPDTGIDIIEKYNFQHYLKSGRFKFQEFIKSYYSPEFDYASNAINNFEKSYFYILRKLTANKRLEFKNDILDHLKEVSDFQKISKFKALLNGVILRIEKDNSDQPQNFEADNIIDDKESILKLENKLIPSQKTLHIPYAFFKNLTTEKNRNGQVFIDEEVLLNFLKDAFHLMKGIPTHKINKGNREQVRITYFFYEFMSFSQKNDYENSSQNNTKYLKILTDNFINFSFETIIGNFKKKPATPILTIKY